MTSKLFPATILAQFVAALVLLADAAACAQAAGLKFQIQLVWATDDAKPPVGKDYKPVEPQIRKEIKALKWKNYFEVRRIDFVVPPGSPKKVALSGKCELD